MKEYSETKCKLFDGSIHVYDMCDEKKDAYNEFPVFQDLIYVGQGTIYSIRGQKQNGKAILHFWKLKPKTENL